jgi:hypothetical protein
MLLNRAKAFKTESENSPLPVGQNLYTNRKKLLKFRREYCLHCQSLRALVEIKTFDV